jgi:hypothetical protein
LIFLEEEAPKKLALKSHSRIPIVEPAKYPGLIDFLKHEDSPLDHIIMEFFFQIYEANP